MHETVTYTGQEATALGCLRKLCLAYPEAHEVEQFGHPWFKAGKRPFAVFGGHPGDAAIAFAVSKEDQHDLCAMSPGAFFPTPYMHQHGWTSLKVAAVDWPMVEELLETAYRRVALKRMVKALEARA